MEILVLAPYEAKLLKAVYSAKKINLGIFTLLGNKRKIHEVCFLEKIDFSVFDIIDCEEEKDIIDFCKKYLLKDALYVINGNISNYYLKKLYSASTNEEFNYINIIDFPLINHFLFVSSFTNKETGCVDKKKSVVKVYNFMNKLGIKKVNAALVASNKTKAETLEANIMKMILKESNYKMIDIIASYKLYDLFEEKSLVNVYKNNINLLIFRNSDLSNTFLETLSLLGSCKIASIININDNFVIDTKDLKNDYDIIFSILVLLKTIKKENALLNNN